jgi:DNA-binding GntR family transcriptional regulator
MSDTPAPGSLKAIKADRSLANRVRESIRQAIIDGQLPVGSLHSVQSLADVFKVSRTPVREALIDLAAIGMVEFERNRGVRIHQTSAHGLEEIMVIRILLEVPAAYRAAGRISEDQLKELRVEHVAMTAAADAGDESVAMHHDRRFHELINLASGNKRLTSYVDSLRDLVVTSGVSTAGRSRSLSSIVDEHSGILEAMVRRDSQEAATGMKQHLVRTATLLLQQETGADFAIGWESLVVGETSADGGS